MAMNRNTAVTIFTLIGVIAGIFIGWLIFAPSKPKTPNGTGNGGTGGGNGGNGGNGNGTSSPT